MLPPNSAANSGQAGLQTEINRSNLQRLNGGKQWARVKCLKGCPGRLWMSDTCQTSAATQLRTQLQPVAKRESSIGIKI